MKNEKTFEQSLERLEEIIEKLEDQDTPLEQAMELFSQGVELSSQCAEKLENAKQAVHILMEKDGKMVKEEFSADEE